MKAPRAFAVAVATSLALSVSALAAADPDPKIDAKPATPLQLRQQSPASPDGGTSSAGWKLAGIAAIAGGVALWLRNKRKAGLKPQALAPALRVVARSSIGARSELLVVDVGGQRFLLGATPTSINHIADVDVETERASAPSRTSFSNIEGELIEPRHSQSAPRADVGSRFHALLDGALGERTDHADDEDVEAQAKNLVVLRRRP